MSPLAVALAAALLFAPAVRAQSAAQESGVELSPQVRLSLQRVQEQWSQWVAAFYRDNREGAAAAERELRGIAGSLGMPRLPDIALAMTARAVEAARGGHPERVAWALEAAESLDPGRPEIAFGAARAAWASGSYLASLNWLRRGVQRLAASEPERSVLGRSLLLWAVAAVLLTGVLFVVVQVGVKGPTVYRDLAAIFGKRLGTVGSHVLAVLALAWPLALPSGLVWFLLWASVLVWGHASASERAALGAVWVVAALGPALAGQQHAALGVALSPPVRAMASVESGRLYGAIFSDLGVLRSALPESAAVKELVADFHRRLGQWEYARALYRQVLEDETSNVDAMLALGAFYFRKGEFATASQYFQRAAAVEPPSATAYYDLSLSYSEAYQFEESRQALAKARQIDDERVMAWVRAESPERVVVFEGGLRRAREIRERLASSWRRDRAARTFAGEGRRWLPLLILAFAALAAVGWDQALRRFGGGVPVPLSSSRRGRGEIVLGLLLPAWRLTEDGDGGRAIASLIGPVLLVLLALGARFTVVPPAGLAALAGSMWSVAGIGLLAVGLFRLRRLLSRGA